MREAVRPSDRSGRAPVHEIGPLNRPIRGTWTPPGDKSISHRAAILAAMAEGDSVVESYSPARDCRATLDVLSSLGIGIESSGGPLRVSGRGVAGLGRPDSPLDCRRSGTTMRLMAGVLAAAPFRSVLTGDPQLLRRPMERVARPLRLMGARIELLGPADRPPLEVEGNRLTGIPYRLPLPSAQVKSAVVLAGLSATGTTTVIEPVPTRDHTERMLAWLEVPVERLMLDDGARRVSVRATAPPPFDLRVPGDLSSAAFIAAAAALVPGSDVRIENVGLNPTRMGFVEALVRMGGAVEVTAGSNGGPEPVGTIRVRHAPLRGVSLGPRDIPAMIDELPLFVLLATQAEGATEVHGASELRVKESDRITELVAGLRTLGADVEERPEGFLVRGPTRLGQGVCDPKQDHRLAMTFAVAGLTATGPVRVRDIDAVADSFPGFVDALGSLR